jgi:hypothetical protein
MKAVAASSVPVPPAGRSSIFLDVADLIYKAKLPDGSVILLSVSEEAIRDIIGTMIQDSNSIDFQYDDINNTATFEVKESGLNVFEIPISPANGLTSDNVGDALYELQLEITNVVNTAVEVAQDAVAQALANGTQDGVLVVYDDANDKFDVTNTDKGSDAVSSHEAALDPHPQYTTTSEASAAAPVQSVAGKTGNVTLDTSDVSETSNLYFTESRVRSTVLTGLTLLVGGIISATDTVLSALGKLQKQITDNLTTLTNHTSNTSNPHSTTASQVGAYTTGQTDTQISNAITAHEAALDPHTQYLTTTEGNAAYAPSSHVGSGGTQHANATTSIAGFMSSVDKTKLDGISGSRIIKAGQIAAATFVGAPRTATVTFGTPMPNTNYSISIIGGNGRLWTYQTKTVNGFVINTNSNTALTAEVSWMAISNGETVE